MVDGNNDNNTTIATIHKSQDGTIRPQNSSKVPQGNINAEKLVWQRSETTQFIPNQVDNAPVFFGHLGKILCLILGNTLFRHVTTHVLWVRKKVNM